MERPAGRRVCLYDARQLDGILDRMARKAAGLLTGEPGVVLVGIRRRGVPIAAMLERRLAERFGLGPIPRLELAISRYADDLTLLYPETRLVEDPAHAALDLAGRTVMVVDDVMYQGHSMLRAVEWVARRSPAVIRTVVLVDRDVARLPVRTDIVGARLDVAPGDIIECNVPPYEPEFRIDLCQPEGRG
ncbi:MAG: phosphoribosyltransferase family protein [Burkholderiales bacterium]|nr:phosphoribosyltransferase family protein [Burkholderiales bacterium]